MAVYESSLQELVKCVACYKTNNSQLHTNAFPKYFTFQCKEVIIVINPETRAITQY